MLENNKKKKIIIGSLISAAVLTVGGATFYLVTQGDSDSIPQALKLSKSKAEDSKTNNSNSSVNSSSSSAEKENSSSTEKEKESSSSASSSNSASSTRRDERRDSVPITESRLNNIQEAGSRPIAPISQVRDLVSRSTGQQNTSNEIGSRPIAPIAVNDTIAKNQEKESKRLAELEKYRNANRAIQNLQSRPQETPKPTEVEESPSYSNSTPASPTVNNTTTNSEVIEENNIPTVETPAPTPTPTNPVEKVESENKPNHNVETPKPEDVVKPSTPTPTVEGDSESSSPVKPSPSIEIPDLNIKPTNPIEEAPKVKDGEEQNVAVTITNQEDLDSYLKRTGTDLSGDKVIFDLKESIKLPNANYKIREGETVWSFKGNGKVVTIDLGGSNFLEGIGGDFFWLFNGQYGDESGSTLIKNGNFYGSVKSETEEDGSIKTLSKGSKKHPSLFNNGESEGEGRFSAMLLKASYLTFKDLQFNNVQAEGTHVYDVAGSHHIAIENNLFAGYGGKELTDIEVEKRFNKDSKSVYAEAIHINAANFGTFGSINRKGTILEDVELDKIPSIHLTIESNGFTTYKGVDGEGIINGDSSEVVVRNYSSGIGSHNKGITGYHHIAIRGNRFENTSDFKNNITEDRHLAYPIHLDGVDDLEVSKIFVVGNTFSGEITPKLDSGVLHNNRVAYSAIQTGANNETPNKPKDSDDAEKARLEALEHNKKENEETSIRDLKPKEENLVRNYNNSQAKEAFEKWSEDHKITPKEKALLNSLIQKESNWDPEAVQGVGGESGLQFYGLLMMNKEILSKESLTNPYKQLEDFYTKFVSESKNSIAIALLKISTPGNSPELKAFIEESGGIEEVLKNYNFNDSEKEVLKQLSENL
jgi:singapore isolate B (sub-type 7) whole genome shotgun sequence assembly, scaffold_0